MYVQSFVPSRRAKYPALVERPATKWPDVFGDASVFTTYPYLLPCAIAALIMLLGMQSEF